MIEMIEIQIKNNDDFIQCIDNVQKETRMKKQEIDQGNGQIVREDEDKSGGKLVQYVSNGFMK